MLGDHPSGRTRRRGFVIGELLVALLLLAVAVSSLAALMYSVSRRPASSAEKAECLGKNASSAKCLAQQRSGEDGASKLLRSGCATRLGLADKSCKDTILSADNSSETVVKPRTDSASMALLPKKRERVAVRPDRGFIR